MAVLYLVPSVYLWVIKVNEKWDSSKQGQDECSCEQVSADMTDNINTVDVDMELDVDVILIYKVQLALAAVLFTMCCRSIIRQRRS